MRVVYSKPKLPAVPTEVSQDATIYKESSIVMQAGFCATVFTYDMNCTTPTSPARYTESLSASSHYQFGISGPAAKFVSPVQRRVPQEVYDAILNNLEVLHKAPHQTGCTTCFQRDLHALTLTCRTWERAARERLYTLVHIVGNDSPAQLKRYRLKKGSRLKLLRRTLRERSMLANLVRELRVPQMNLLFISKKQTTQWQEYRDLVASVVMACPNLERLLGISIPYRHEFDRLTHALSTRKWLKEHIWILDEENEVIKLSSRGNSCTKPLRVSQMLSFLDYHASWHNLETLVFHSLNGNGALEHSIFLRVFDLLPSLRNICISSFEKNSFVDSTLLCLPPLESLRLENLPGVTDAGIAQYAMRPESQSLKALVLIEQNIESLLTISKLLASLRRLERFKIVQEKKCPVVEDETWILQPILASSSLKYLHWDVACSNSDTAIIEIDSVLFKRPPNHINTPNSLLAQSILTAGFPFLETLRAPNDCQPPGALQAVCKPTIRGQALLRRDRDRLVINSHDFSNIRPHTLPAGNNLSCSRIRAQAIIDMVVKNTENGMPVFIMDYSDDYAVDNALVGKSEEKPGPKTDCYGTRGASNQYKRNHPATNINEPKMVYKFRMPTFMGRSGVRDPITGASIPQFYLYPDIPGQDLEGGLIGWKQLLAYNQELPYGKSVEADVIGNSSRPPIYPPVEDMPPLSYTGSSHLNWATLGSRPTGTSAASITSIAAMSNMPSSSSWSYENDTCIGSWNHNMDRDWWFHVERDRPTNLDLVDVKQLF